MTALPKTARQGDPFLACNECRLQRESFCCFSAWLFNYALMFLDLMSEASAEDRLQLRFLCNTLPGDLSNNQHDVCRWEERWPAQTDEGESERQAEKSNDMLWQSWEVTGMMEYIYIAETLCPRKERKTERERDEERRDRNKRSSVSSSAIKEIQFVTFKSELNAMK